MVSLMGASSLDRDDVLGIFGFKLGHDIAERVGQLVIGMLCYLFGYTIERLGNSACDAADGVTIATDTDSITDRILKVVAINKCSYRFGYATLTYHLIRPMNSVDAVGR